MSTGTKVMLYSHVLSRVGLLREIVRSPCVGTCALTSAPDPTPHIDTVGNDNVSACQSVDTAQLRTVDWA